MSTARGVTGIGRRAFATGCGALPVLAGIFDPRRRAQAAPGSPLRLVIWHHGEGALREPLFPTGTETAFTFPVGSKAIEPWKSRTLVLDGCSNIAGLKHLAGDTHEKAYTGLLTGNTLTTRLPCCITNEIAPSESLDQFLGPKVRGAARLSSIELSVEAETTGGQGVSFPLGGGASIAPIKKVSTAFDRLFLGIASGTGGTITVDDSALRRLRNARASMLDYVAKDLTSLGKKLGAADARKLAAHLQSIRDIERDLSMAVTPAATKSCAPLQKPVDPNPKDSMTIPAHTKTMMDLMVQALACDITRVITYSPSWAGERGMPWNGQTDSYHGIGHQKIPGKDLKTYLPAYLDWHYKQMASFLQQLESIKEGDGTLLDHTLILSIHDFSNSDSHNFENLFTLVIGSGNGFFKTGRFMHLGGKGKPHNNVLCAVANAMGVPITSFGEAGLTDPAVIASLRA